MPGEFDIIDKYFAPLAGPEGLALKDDASVWAIPSGFDLVVTKDILNEGVHFRTEDPPDLLAYKAIAVSVSDCVAKGASPAQYWLGLSLSQEPNDDWLRNFCGGLKRAQQDFGCTISGGDTTKSLGGLTVSVTVAGLIPSGKMIKRSGAKVGDAVFVTGELGNAALGLHELLSGKYGSSELVQAYQSPSPPLVFGQQLSCVANAAADISDGLIADAGHIARQSQVRLQIFQDRLPVGQLARAMVEREAGLAQKIWSGGDDYQILFTAPVSAEPMIKKIARESKTLVTNIGEVTVGDGVQLLDQNNEIVHVTSGGYEHF